MRWHEIQEAVGRITKQNQTADVGPDEVTKQAAKFGNKVDKDGRPPTLSKKVKGSSTNVAFNLGLAERKIKSKSYKKSLKAVSASGKRSKSKLRTKFNEGYKLQLERDKEMLVLHIKDTATGKRTEVRGKPGYETDYDPNDKLHILLDKVGKSANISELMNGEVVSINPNHPDADRAKAATDVAYNEALDQPYPVRWTTKDDDEWEGKAKTEAGDSIQIMITQGYNNYKWEVDFYVGGSMQVTGKGDQFRVFATVVSAVKEWWSWLSKSKQPVEAIIFSAFKGNKSAKGSAGRSSLYNRFANQFARSIGFTVSTIDRAEDIKFVLTNPNYKDQQTENFADGKKKGKSRPGRVKRAGASCNGSVTDLRKRAKNASGEKSKMLHWCANMKAGRKKNK